MLNVAFVLRSGGDFTAEHVRRLAANVSSHLTIPHRLICLTDRPAELAGFRPALVPIRMAHNYPRWWGKLELFRPDIFPPGDCVLFIDLDTIILGNLDEIAAGPTTFAGLRDFYFPQNFASGLMKWTAGEPDLYSLYKTFSGAACHYMSKAGGDQRFIREQWTATRRPFSFLQDAFPGQIASFKAGCRNLEAAPAGVRVLCFHGKPRPWECDAPWVREELAKY